MPMFVSQHSQLPFKTHSPTKICQPQVDLLAVAKKSPWKYSSLTLHLLTALTIAKTKRTISLSVSMGKLFDMRWYISLSTNTAVSTCTGARTARRNRDLNCDVSGMLASGLTPQNEPVSVSLRPWLWGICLRTIMWGGESDDRLVNLFGSGFIT